MPKLIMVPLGEAPRHRRQTLATGRMRLAVIAAAHRLGGNPDQPSRPLVKTTALVNLGPPAGDAGRVAPALWWGDVEVHEAGSGRQHVVRSKN